MSVAPPSTLDRIRCHLVGLKMPRALEMLEHTLRQLERGEVSALEAIDALLGEELSLREGRRVKAALKMGRLLTIKTLASFDFTFQPSLDKNRILALAQLDFVDRHEVVHFLGQPGCGKTHLALGAEAVKAGQSVYFATLADLVGSLAKAEREGTLHERLRFLCRPQLLIADSAAFTWRVSSSTTSSPAFVRPACSHCDSGPASSPIRVTTQPSWSKNRISASGSLRTLASRTIRPVASTTHTLLCSSDTSIPA